MSRRCKIVRVPRELLVDGFFRRDDRARPDIEIWAEGLPADARIVKSRVNEWDDCLEFLFESAAWPEVPVNEMWPYAGWGEITFHSQRRGDADAPAFTGSAHA